MEEKQISTTYDAQEWEDKLYALWEKSGFFNPDKCIEAGITDETRPTFSIVLPPPNVTGTLHAGHASMLAIEDTIVRYHRMKGDRTLWIPGTDHASIATQSKVEKILTETEGKTRHDLGREEFLKRVEKFAQDSHDTIVNQCKKMGSSLDWSREAYTLDEKRSLSVRTAFKKMYDDGIIYRGERIVNWDPKMQTTVSDDEIEWETETVPLYYFQYGPFVISTARPETKFGDKYVVMHPDDERYQEYTHGQKIELEWISGKITATIIKDSAIDKDFGTGVMTITPWHDNTDFEIALRHNLDKEQIIDENGFLLPIAGELAGLPIKEAREKIIEKLQEKNLIVKIEENYSHNIATNSRGGGIIEPQIKKQWWINVNKEFERNGKMVTLKSLMQNAVRSKEVTILPSRFDKIYFHWIDNLRDWCISRQIWFGHRIPVWYCLNCKHERIDATVKSRWFFMRHGETDHNKNKVNAGSTDIPLNDIGREQAQEASKKLSTKNIDVIFSSNLSRARETAEIIGREIGIKEIIIDDRLQERNLGDAEGVSYSETKERFPDLYAYDGKPADNESYHEMEERIWDAISEHLENHKHKNVLIVSHGAALRTLIRRVRDIDPEDILTIPALPNASPFSFDVLEPCEKCGSHFFEQDPDTLDTWFSSGLWTFSTLGWPDIETKDFKDYHPTALLETGYDIIFFWVARMILMSEYLLGVHPFDTVYLHGLVRDEQGRKMSKSLGNVMDPLIISEKYGADALRIALISGSAPGNDLKLSDEKILAMRNFTNKIWNLARYVGTQLATNNSQPTTKPEAKTDADHWILTKLSTVTKSVTQHLDCYELSLAAEELRDFTWGDFADWYVEIHKVEKNDAVLRFVLDTILKLWHPFMPFVTEAIHQTFHFEKSEFLMVAPWPRSEEVVNEKRNENSFELVKNLIIAIRNARATYHIEPSQKMAISVRAGSEKTIRDNEEIFKRLARISEIHTLDTDIPENSILIRVGLLQVFLHLDGIIDISKERGRFEKEKSEKEKYIASLQTKLNNKNFVERAKPEIVEVEQTKLNAAQKELVEIKEHLASLL